MDYIKIIEALVKLKIADEATLNALLAKCKKENKLFARELVNAKIIDDVKLLGIVEKIFSKPSINLTNFIPEKSLVTLMPKDFCVRNRVLPVSKAAGTLVVACADPSNINIIDQVKYISKFNKIQPVVSTENMILTILETHFIDQATSLKPVVLKETDAQKDDAYTQSKVEVLTDTGDNSSVTAFVNAVLTEAVFKRVSDIHFEPFETNYRVRFRIDGNLIEYTNQPASFAPAIASRLKIMAKLDIAEKRRPQDGRMKIRLQTGKEMDFRVNTIPSMWGEKIVLRLLDKSNLQLDMLKLGFEADDLKVFQSALALPQGMVLITGPTGSGKTTTIYSALAHLNKVDVNISTAEDPIEFNLAGIVQTQMNPEIDFTFATALKAFLRQDPDVIMVGEIRDLETAEIAFKAASTGHLVLSTLHTNDAPSTVIRIAEMGIPTYMITANISLIVAQRLVGKICENCKEPIKVEDKVLAEIGVPAEDIPNYKLFKGKGCANCNNTGYKGRVAVYELMPLTEKIKEAINKGATQGQIRYLCRSLGLKTLRRSALLKLKAGLTTVDEVLNASVKDF